MKHYANCAFCGKLVELSRPPRYHVYCSEECKMRFKALERGVTTELIHEILCEHKAPMTKAELLKALKVRDPNGRKVVWWLVEFMERHGIVVIDRSDELNPTVALTRKWEVMCLEDLEQLEKLLEMIDKGAEKADKLNEIEKRIKKLEERMEIVEKKVDILRKAVEKLAKVLAGQ